jgi:hypothetical protein
MKLTIASIALSVIAASSANAGLFDSLATSDWPVKESNAFKVEAYGYDFRVYEWVSEANPNVVCSVAIGNSNSAPYMGMQCFEKPDKKDLMK